jgi:signal transduction histidine kinase
VWANLLDNALDAVSAGGRVELAANRESALWWSVIDNGASVPEVRDRIFDPFFTTKPIGEGTGWGWTSSGGWFSGITGGSNWTRARAERSFA